MLSHIFSFSFLKLKVVFVEVSELVLNILFVPENAVQLALDMRQFLVLESLNFFHKLSVEVKSCNQLLVHCSRCGQFLGLGVSVCNLFLLVQLLAHSHGQVAHLRQGLEVGEESEVLRDVLLSRQLISDITTVATFTTAHGCHHTFNNVGI